MDGCNLRINRPKDPIVADKFYNMWKGMHCVGNLFVWAPDGTIIHAYYSAVGGLHDSSLANEAYDLIAETDPQYVVLADSALYVSSPHTSLRNRRTGRGGSSASRLHT